MTRPI